MVVSSEYGAYLRDSGTDSLLLYETFRMTNFYWSLEIIKIIRDIFNPSTGDWRQFPKFFYQNYHFENPKMGFEAPIIGSTSQQNKSRPLLSAQFSYRPLMTQLIKFTCHIRLKADYQHPRHKSATPTQSLLMNFFSLIFIYIYDDVKLVVYIRFIFIPSPTSLLPCFRCQMLHVTLQYFHDTFFILANVCC